MAPKPAAVEESGVALELSGVFSGYGDTAVLRDVDLVIPTGSVVALLGPNGAGKTTLLRTAAGLLRQSAGVVSMFGSSVGRTAPHERAARGICLIPEGRGVFPGLTVAENLRMQRPTWCRDKDGLDRAIEAFPDLGHRMDQLAGSMSGGQQQMLALSRAWVAQPRIVLLDEVSMGLAPRVVDEIFTALRRLAASGVTLLLVEQYVSRALSIADQVNLMDKGEISFSGSPQDLDQDALVSGYLGGEPAGPDAGAVRAR
ncbi:ABC transporter ATP-binding protein [uncultured Arthrobacter sp.]|uniref:ABC transporter ATP-binding protein n=1 Tax=uncultured Arthrobacter sp. TaxID=114050 RepID=UPI0025D82124|nr:ABC transporter ATP-binding protein [uncultured Arthrobacter sp.]